MEAGGVLLSFPGCSALRSHRGAVPPSSRRRVTQVIGISVSFPGKRPHTGHRAPLNEIWAQRQGPGGLADLQICTMCVHTQASVTVSARKSLHMCACLCARMCLSACRSGRKGAPSLSWEWGDGEKSSRRCPGLAPSPHTQTQLPILLLSRIMGFGWVHL